MRYFVLMTKNPKPTQASVRGDAKTFMVEKNAAAVMLGRLGGLKGGIARAESLSADRRREIAVKAARTRWGVKDD